MLSFKEFILEIAKIKRGFPKVQTKRYMDIGFHTNPGKDKLFSDNTKGKSYHLRLYTDDSRFLNHPLSKGKKLGKIINNFDQELSNTIKKHKIPEDTYLYHGSNHLHKLHKMKPNKDGVIIVHHKQYTSTSLSHQTAADFAAPQPNFKNEVEYNHVMKIHVPAGSHGVTTKKYNHPSEREILLHKDAKFAVHPKPTFDNKKGLVTWHANLIHDGINPTKHND